MKSVRKAARRPNTVRRAPPLNLTMRVERLEKALLFKKTASVPQSPNAVEPRPRFINLNADGKPTKGDHVAVYQTETGLIWTAAPLRDGTDLTHAEAIQAATDLRLLGAKDWRLPSIRELLPIVDYELCDPAVDQSHFKGPYGWTWSGTIAKAPAGYAWGVGLGGGGSGRDRQGNRGRALAVRAGQQLGLGI